MRAKGIRVTIKVVKVVKARVVNPLAKVSQGEKAKVTGMWLRQFVVHLLLALRPQQKRIFPGTVLGLTRGRTFTCNISELGKALLPPFPTRSS
jgi:hypothetical protein